MKKLDIETIKENRDFHNISDKEALLIIDTLYDYSVSCFATYKKYQLLSNN